MRIFVWISLFCHILNPRFSFTLLAGSSSSFTLIRGNHSQVGLDIPPKTSPEADASEEIPAKIYHLLIRLRVRLQHSWRDNRIISTCHGKYCAYRKVIELGTREAHVGVDLTILLEKAKYKDKIYQHGMLNLGLNSLTRLVWGNYKVNLEHLLGPESKEALKRKINWWALPISLVLIFIYKKKFIKLTIIPIYYHQLLFFHLRNSEKIITRSKMTCVRNIRN